MVSKDSPSFLCTLMLLSFLSGVFLTVTYSQDYLIDFQHIGMAEGLPARMTYSIQQDKKGYIWFSTQIGIHRYDGYNFKTYMNSELGLDEGQLVNLSVDAQNRIWYWGKRSTISNSHGGILDAEKDSVFTIESISNGEIKMSDVGWIDSPDPQTTDILIGTRSGNVFCYAGKSSTFRMEKLFQLPVGYRIFSGVTVSKDSTYWVSFYSFDDNNVIFRAKQGEEPVLVGQFLGEIAKLNTFSWIGEKLLVEVKNINGYQYFVLVEDKFIPYPNLHDGRLGSEENGMNRQISISTEHFLFVTSDSLFVMNNLGQIVSSFEISVPKERRKNFDFNYSLVDNQGNVWVTSENGIYKLTTQKNPFSVLLRDQSLYRILSIEDDLWIGGHPLTWLEGKRKKTLPPVLTQFAPNNISKDADGQIWLARLGEVAKYFPNSDSLEIFSLDSQTIMATQVFLNRTTQHFWIVSETSLNLMDFQNKVNGTYHLGKEIISESPNGIQVKQIYENTEGIWLVADNGLFLIDKHTESLIKHYSQDSGLPYDYLKYLYEDDDGIFWLATKGGGLIRWDRRENSFMQFKVEEGLSNNNLYAVYEDEYETLWLPSDYGLMAFDKKSFSTRVFLPQNGIAHEEFNTWSHFQDVDGTLYFGGLGGITWFHPRDFHTQMDTIEPPLYITKVKVLPANSEVFTDETVSFQTDNLITLQPDDRILELELSFLDFANNVENQFAYRIKGYQEQWIYPSGNKLSFINLPFGDYELEIRARGASGTWTQQLLKIPLLVKTPFYRKIWFLLLMIALLILLIFLGVRIRLNVLRKDKQLLELEVIKRTEQIAAQTEELKELDKAKSRFFSNITHEFRTPLTLVTGPVEQMIDEKPPIRFKERLDGVLQNARTLMDLNNQLLDLSKLEGGLMKVEIFHGDIIHYTKKLVHRFQLLAESKKIQLEFKADTDVWKTQTDIGKWTKIVYNLISNAIKFTPNCGNIIVNLKQLRTDNKEYIELRVKDTGIGIAAENMQHIFDRFYQADASSTRLQGGTGIGLSLVKELVELQNGTIDLNSIVGKGTEFIVTLPAASVPVVENTHPKEIPDGVLLPVTDKEILHKKEVVAENGNHLSENEEKLELLIIEDNAEMRTYIRSCIDASVYNISEAANGEEGIAKSLEMVPDLIISDVMMPKKNGFEVTRAIREHTATSHIPLILLTAKASLESRLEGLQRGADAYLTKPFSPKELTLRIKKLIEIRKLLLNRYKNNEGPPEANDLLKKEDQFVSELKTYIVENISEPNLGVEAISRHFAISRMQLYRKLKALMDKPIADYIRTMRLETAVQLLKGQQYNIAEVAYASGFSSPSHFSRVFKKVYGKSPSEL